jgi:hypothetical protein
VVLWIKNPTKVKNIFTHHSTRGSQVKDFGMQERRRGELMLYVASSWHGWKNVYDMLGI